MTGDPPMWKLFNPIATTAPKWGPSASSKVRVLTRTGVSLMYLEKI